MATASAIFRRSASFPKSSPSGRTGAQSTARWRGACHLPRSSLAHRRLIVLPALHLVVPPPFWRFFQVRYLVHGVCPLGVLNLLLTSSVITCPFCYCLARIVPYRVACRHTLRDSLGRAGRLRPAAVLAVLSSVISRPWGLSPWSSPPCYHRHFWVQYAPSNPRIASANRRRAVPKGTALAI